MGNQHGGNEKFSIGTIILLIIVAIVFIGFLIAIGHIIAKALQKSNSTINKNT